MKQYRELVERILSEGNTRGDRTGTGTIGVFGHQMRFDLREGFPLLTLKKTNFKPIAEELFWFLRGETNISTLNAKIWDEWAFERFCKYYKKQYGLTTDLVPYTLAEFSELMHNGNIDNKFIEDHGDLGPIYGKQWRSWQGGQKRESIDQLANVIADLKKNPFSRRHVVTAWNPTDLEFMSLPPCHLLFQFYAEEMCFADRIDWHNATCEENHAYRDMAILDGLGVPKYHLSCQLYQRSGDVGIGIPFNIASYALLTELIARECNMVAKEFVHCIGDAHIYLPHVEAMKEVLIRSDLPLSQLTFKTGYDFENQSLDTVQVINYQSHPFIKLPIAV